MALLEFTDRGIYCPQADVYLDPWKPVKRAIISHGHSDHATYGHGHYLCTRGTEPIIRHRLSLRLSLKENVQSLPYGEAITINHVNFSFFPAGHIPGSAQIRVEHRGDVWVFSGDYKRELDNISEPFEPLRCNTFITESTFGLPVYKWPRQADTMNDINTWWRKNQNEGKVSIIAGYTLGKSQRIIKNIDPSVGKIFVHGAVHVMNHVLMQNGLTLPETIRVTPEMKRADFEGGIVVCPPSAVGSTWIKKFFPYSVAIASGWMLLRGTRRRRGTDRGFVLSDHADWNDLNITVKETGAEKVFVTHGYAEIYSQWLCEQQIDAHDVKTQYEGELGEMAESAVAAEETEGGENIQ
jgi:putative mRNA 3-end processing factor